MGQSSNNVSVQNNPVLETIYRGYLPAEGSFIHDQVLPTLPVNAWTADGIKMTSTATDILRVINNVRLGRAKTPEIEVGLTKSTMYKTEEHALKILVTKEDGKQFNISDWRAGMEEAKVLYTEFLKKTNMIAKEYALASAIFNTSNFTNNETLTGADQWSDFVNSDPRGDFRTAKQTVRSAIQQTPNTAVMGVEVEDYMVDHPQLKITNGVMPDGTVPIRSLTRAEVAKALGIDKIVVGDVNYDGAEFGQTSSLTQIWGKYCLITYVNPNPQPRQFEKSLGYSFTLEDAVVDSYLLDDPKGAEYIRVVEEYDDVILDETSGYLYAGVVA